MSLSYFLPCFLLGSIAAIVYPLCSSTKEWQRILVMVAVALVVVGSTNSIRQSLFHDDDNGWLGNKFIFFGTLFGALLIFTIDAPGTASKILGNRPITFIGLWSFPIYLFHWAIFAQLVLPS